MAPARSERRLSLPGIEVAYERYGRSATSLVFVHGWTCDRSVWTGQSPLFDKYSSLLVDLPGHGQSGIPEVQCSIELFAQAIDAILNHEKIGRAILIGHSMGGPVCTSLLRSRPESILGIVYVDSFLRMPTADWSKAERQDLYSKLESDIFFASTTGSLLRGLTNEKKKTRVATVMNNTSKRVRQEVVATKSCLTSAIGAEKIYPLPAIHIFEAGGPYEEFDPCWTQHLPNLQMQNCSWTRGLGHFFFVQDADSFNHEVVDFLSTKISALPNLELDESSDWMLQEKSSF